MTVTDPPSTITTTHLDQLTPLQSRVGWGRLGIRGDLGYEGKAVCVGGRRYEHAISSHPPARILYYLGGSASTFRCKVALNDDVPLGSSYADFAVIADGSEVAHARYVVAGEVPRDLSVEIAGAQLLELTVSSARWPYSHAVWLEPELDALPDVRPPKEVVDALGYATIELPPPLPRVERCIATVASPGFETMLDDMLGSLVANGGCPGARIVVLLLGASPACETVIAKYRAVPVRCKPLRRLERGCKAILYSIALVAPAERYLCLDADTLVLGDLASLFAAIDVCPAGSVLASREGNSGGLRDLSEAIREIYDGEDADFARLLGSPHDEGSYRLVVNDGVFAGSHDALLALDATLRAMPGAFAWLEERPDVAWRNQFLFNLALARVNCGIQLDDTNNIQLHTTDVEVEGTDVTPAVRWQGQKVRILHVSGYGRGKHPELLGLYAGVPDPLVGAGDGDSYAEFLGALRAWVGRHGLSGLDQTFYGTWELVGGRVRDPSTLPIFALVHYLIRASGCVRVLETGTMKGVSAACLASAVAHRPGGLVVSFDPVAYPGRQELWDSLPERMRAAIEARAVDSIAGLGAALDAGERYDGALLDSVHTEEHVWAEFELATRLVCPGGPILVHDWRPDEGMQRALARIESAGHGVARLLGPCGVEEDSGLGIALIENRTG